MRVFKVRLRLASFECVAKKDEDFSRVSSLFGELSINLVSSSVVCNVWLSRVVLLVFHQRKQSFSSKKAVTHLDVNELMNLIKVHANYCYCNHPPLHSIL